MNNGTAINNTQVGTVLILLANGKGRGETWN